MPKIDVDTLPVRTGSNYLPPYDTAAAGRAWQEIGGGLTQFGANIVTLAPGAWSSQRHWHSAEDEMVIMLTGEAVLLEDDGGTVLIAGDIACFPANSGNGHHLQNQSNAPCSFVAIGTNHPDIDQCHYPDIDMHLDASGFRRKAERPA